MRSFRMTTYAMAGWIMVLAGLLIIGPAYACPATLDFEMRPLNGSEPVQLCQAYQDTVVLIVNKAL